MSLCLRHPHVSNVSPQYVQYFYLLILLHVFSFMLILELASRNVPLYLMIAIAVRIFTCLEAEERYWLVGNCLVLIRISRMCVQHRDPPVKEEENSSVTHSCSRSVLQNPHSSPKPRKHTASRRVPMSNLPLCYRQETADLSANELHIGYITIIWTASRSSSLICLPSSSAYYSFSYYY